MNDLYQTLGIRSDATAYEIKKAYRKLALNAHPDKGGDEQMMRLLNEAYSTLLDSNKRKMYDESWDAYSHASATDDDKLIPVSGYLSKGKSLPNSYAYRQEHAALSDQYKYKPLTKRTTSAEFKPIESGIYHYKNEKYHDIFTFIKLKTLEEEKSTVATPTQLLTPGVSIAIFLDFLSGQYVSLELELLKKYLANQIKLIKSKDHDANTLSLYEGISEIINASNGNLSQHRDIIFSVKKITDYAKNVSTLFLTHLMPLFHNKYFRNLYAQALITYLNKETNLLNESGYDGLQETKELLKTLKDRLINIGSKNHAELIRYINLLYQFEKDSHNRRNNDNTSEKIRESAFHFIDWLPAISDNCSRQIIINLLIQIGLKFQKSSVIEPDPSLAMADEQLALTLFLSAISQARNSTPDVELYANTHCLKYIKSFRFQNDALDQRISALKKRTLLIADIFPFFEDCQSNISFSQKQDQRINLMRQFLKNLVYILQHNKKNSNRIPLDHPASTILYCAFEACLKNWYDEKYDSATEKKFRIDLMDELLNDKGWTFFDVEQRVDSEWIMVNRDKAGWLKPSRSLPYTEDNTFIKYSDINGAEINFETGEIQFYLEPWKKEQSLNEMRFTLFDLQQILEKNLNFAIFSLDQVDPDKQYHPFNQMRFWPDRLYDSELLNTMLLTDYMLKFLTTNQEIQGQYPFNQKRAADMIQHLPDYLKKIIFDFQNTSHTGAVHRFWIEAVESNISIEEKASIHRIKLGDLKMVVKKHVMKRDVNGNLVDDNNQDEGWPIYVLTSEQMERVISNQTRIEP